MASGFFDSLIPGLPAIEGIVGDVGGMISSSQNMKEQQANRQQQLDLQKQSWSREDNAVQRRVEDLKKAGINPLLAAGSSAQASAPINVTAPQFQMPNLSAGDKITSAIQAKNNIAITNAQRDLLVNQTDKAISEAKSADYDSQIKGSILDSGIPLASAYAELQAKLIDNLRNRYAYGVDKSIDAQTRGILDSVFKGVQVSTPMIPKLGGKR